MDNKNNKVVDLTESTEAMVKKLTEIAPKVTEQDIAQVVLKCLVSHRTVTRYLKGDIGKLNLAIKMYDILSKAIDARDSLSVA